MYHHYKSSPNLFEIRKYTDNAKSNQKFDEVHNYNYGENIPPYYPGYQDKHTKLFNNIKGLVKARSYNILNQYDDPVHEKYKEMLRVNQSKT